MNICAKNSKWPDRLWWHDHEMAAESTTKFIYVHGGTILNGCKAKRKESFKVSQMKLFN